MTIKPGLFYKIKLKKKTFNRLCDFPMCLYDSFSICEYNYTCIHMYVMWQLSNSNDHCHKDSE